jgi:spoIIIJ-associated protein
VESPVTILTALLRAMGVAYESIDELQIAGQTILSIKTAEAKELIGTHGDALHAIDFLVKKIGEKSPEADSEVPHFTVDVNDYRVKQIKDIQTKALMMAERARSLEYDVELSPMSAYERLIVHTTLQDAPHVKTESHGEGRNRRVVIRYAA